MQDPKKNGYALRKISSSAKCNLLCARLKALYFFPKTIYCITEYKFPVLLINYSAKAISLLSRCYMFVLPQLNESAFDSLFKDRGSAWHIADYERAYARYFYVFGKGVRHCVP